MTLKLVKDKEPKTDSRILENLNPEQIKAVKTISGPVLIVAGAGSGKTRVLTHRIAYLIELGIHPDSVLALTFTNKAADEMKERIASLISKEHAQKVWAGTFHSIFARILRVEAQKIGFTGNFSIYDTDDSLSAIKNVMNSLNISNQEIQPQAARSKISWSKNQMISPELFEASSHSAINDLVSKIYYVYEDYLKANNAMDFDDLLLNFILLLKSSPETLEKYRNIFKHILVDEYQDTNHAQYVAINMLANKYKNICVVGDDAQSIYRWRGADIRNILEFQKDYPEAEVIRLEQNYRSTKTILAAADCVIKNNNRQIPKTLWTDNPDGDKITVHSCYDDSEEADKIIRKIQSIKAKNNFSNKDFAILYRTNAQSLPFENYCRKYNLPYIIVGGMSFYKRKEVKDVMAYLKVLLNPSDNESLLRIVNEPPRGLGQTSLNHLKNYALEKKISLLEAFSEAEQNSELQNRAKNAALAFYNFISKYKNLSKELAADSLARDFINETGMPAMYKEIGTDEAYDKNENIEQVMNDISKFIEENPEKDLVDYLQQISLVSEIDEKDITQEQIKLMTLHSAKGLEFPVVFITGLEQGLFPLTRFDSHPEEIEEERRLFYVGITRAKEKLHLSWCQNRFRYGESQRQKKSFFLFEIDKSYIGVSTEKEKPKEKNEPNVQTRKETTYSQLTDYEDYSQLEPKQTKLRVGSKVKHNIFGTGKVEMLSGEGSSAQATVFFQSVGRKKLILQYAKLKVIT